MNRFDRFTSYSSYALDMVFLLNLTVTLDHWRSSDRSQLHAITTRTVLVVDCLRLV
jgi:hypothetical protein